ncbi:MAG: triose-phosphate isomerase [Candidatus Aminicenantes bacterium]|nr:MAG: triose-phosphate isomerase [Candidatus Aminicenantes bacterium]
MKKEYIIAGNWKMHKTVKESIDFVEDLHEKVAALPQNEAIDILVCPPFTSLYAITGKSHKIKTGAQDLHFEEKGAFTGEISPLMLAGLVDYVLIGHSERRQIFKETDEDINKKIKTALAHGFNPVLCIGETLSEREAGKTLAKIQTQLDQDLEGLSPGEISKLAIAYEPIWAIGTGINATPDQAREAHAFIREILGKKIDSHRAAKDIPILYGGSVKPTNSYDLLSQTDVNGVLVGGASLKIDDFFAIIQDAYKLVNG